MKIKKIKKFFIITMIVVLASFVLAFFAEFSAKAESDNLSENFDTYETGSLTDQGVWTQTGENDLMVVSSKSFSKPNSVALIGDAGETAPIVSTSGNLNVSFVLYLPEEVFSDENAPSFSINLDGTPDGVAILETNGFVDGEDGGLSFCSFAGLIGEESESLCFIYPASFANKWISVSLGLNKGETSSTGWITPYTGATPLYGLISTELNDFSCDGLTISTNASGDFASYIDNINLKKDYSFIGGQLVLNQITNSTKQNAGVVFNDLLPIIALVLGISLGLFVVYKLIHVGLGKGFRG